MATAPSKSSREFTAAEMAKWLADNGFSGAKIVKVLVLGNSGAGKSFLCNAVIGEDTFENKTQAGSVTAANTFVAAVVGDIAFVICNIPGLIEADQKNVPRNKAAIEAAFKFQEGCATICLFVATPTGGRVKNEDYQAIHAVKKYVNLDPAATAFVVNGVDFEDVDDLPTYRAEIEAQVHALVDAGMSVVLCPKVPKSKKSKFDSTEMTELQGQLVTTLQGLRPVTMQPEAGAELVLENERLKKDFEDLKRRIDEQEAAHKAELAQNEAKWRAAVDASEKAHAERMRQMEQTIKDPQNRPPQVIHVGGGGCFSEDTATVVDAASGSAIPMRDVAVGQWIVGVDRKKCSGAGGALVPTRVLLVDRHVGERVAMRRFTIASDAEVNLKPQRLDMTPEHLVLRRDPATGRAMMVQASEIAVGDQLCVRSVTDATIVEWRAVAAIARITATPINVYTTSGTMLVCGVGASCYAVSEWWGWADMLPTRLLGAISPTLPAHPMYERVRKASDYVTDSVLYTLGAVRDRVRRAGASIVSARK